MCGRRAVCPCMLCARCVHGVSGEWCGGYGLGCLDGVCGVDRVDGVRVTGVVGRARCAACVPCEALAADACDQKFSSTQVQITYFRRPTHLRKHEGKPMRPLKPRSVPVGILLRAQTSPP